MKRLLRLCAMNLVVFASILIVIEGIAGYAIAARMVAATSPPLDERPYAKYDSELGWVSEANIQIPDIYGPRGGVRTNSQGFRNDHDFARAVPKGTVRVICSGDSFTFGEGVDNDDTWCQRLTSLDGRLETINMGQRGFGLDQAYLSYKRDGMAFEHQVLVLAFIADDFDRTESDEYAGFHKPVLIIEKGALVVKGVPVPPRRTVSRSLHEGAEHLDTLRVLRGFLQRLGLMRSEQASRLRQLSANGRTRQVVGKILEDLQHLQDTGSRLLILVYIPTSEELLTEITHPWREFIGAQSRALGIPLVDVFDEFRSQSAGLFLQEGEAAAGHLSVKGNELVATLIYNELKKHLAN